MKENKVDNSQKAYQNGKFSKIPSWVKIILLKYWVACAAFYFFIMGGSYLWYKETDPLLEQSLKVILFLGMGYTLFKEYIEKNIIRYMRTPSDDTYKYNMINLHGTISFFLHFLYCMFIATIAAIFCALFINNDNIYKTGFDGYGPFTVGAVMLGFDIICIAIKDLIIYLIKTIKYKKAIQRQNKILAEEDIPVYGENENVEINGLDNFSNDNEEDNNEI